MFSNETFSNWLNWFHEIINCKNLYASYCLICFFNLSYYIGLCPFRLVIKRTESSKPEVSIHQWRPQKIYCVFSTFLSVSWLIREFYNPLGLQTPTGQVSKHPKLIFGYLLQVLSFLMKLITLKSFWMDKPKFLKIANYLLNNECVPKSKTKYHSNVYKQSVIILIFSINVLCTLVTFSEIVMRSKTFGFAIEDGDDKPIWTSMYSSILLRLEKLTSRTIKYQVDLVVDRLDNVCWIYR